MQKIILLALSMVAIGCTSQKPEKGTEIPLITLTTFEIFFGVDDGILSRPMITKYLGGDRLLVYDMSLKKVMIIDEGKVTDHEIGRHGRGPGEFQYISALYINNDKLQIVDIAQRLIHRYTLNGGFLGSSDTGVNQSVSYPPLPPLPSELISNLDSGFYSNITNQPHVLHNGSVLIPADRNTGVLYQMVDLNGDVTREFGEIPDESSFTLDYNEIRQSITNETIPPILRPNSFLVNDRVTDDEIYIVYNSIGELAKYNLTSGQKLWSKSIPMTEETEKLTQDYFNAMNGLLKLADGMSVHRKYLAGVSGPNEELYLLMYNFADKQMWIHKFNRTGELVMRYRFTSEVTLLPVFDIDFEGQRFFVLTEESEIRTYTFWELE